MKIAYLFFAYKNPQLIKKSIDRLRFPGCQFFVHLDSKVCIQEFRALAADDVVFTRRIPVRWGEFSGVEAILILIAEALASAADHDYLVLLSGSEYPIFAGATIRDYFIANQGTEFMTVTKVPNEEAGKPLSRINTLRSPADRIVAHYASRLLARLGLANRDCKKWLGQREPYSGSTWWALTRTACELIHNAARNDDKLVRFFRNAFAPEESFLQTILGNSPLREKMRRNVVFEDWSAGGAHPAMIDATHVEFLTSQAADYQHGSSLLHPYLFARKFSDDTIALTDAFDRIVDQKSSAAAASEEATIASAVCLHSVPADNRKF